MKTLKYILLLLLILIIGFSIYVAVQPNTSTFSRSKTIEAPVSLLYHKVNDYKEWPKFAPWLEQDAQATITSGEQTSGVNASYSWKDSAMGEGSIYTTATETNSSISQEMTFEEPYKSQSNINWFFEPTKDGTKVTWQMDSRHDFMTKLYAIFLGSMETNMGPIFERSLTQLDSVTKAEMKVYSITVEGITQHSGGYYLYTTTSCKLDELENRVSETLPEVAGFAISNNITIAGAPFLIIHMKDEENNAAIFSSCIPTSSRVITQDSNILTGQLESFKAVRTVLKGNRSNVDEAWDQTMSFIATNNLEMVEDGPMLETYVTNTEEEPNPAEWITEIYIAIK